jgi:UDP:flavonoid glycosyltransferase YjiC (YdhE family)
MSESVSTKRMLFSFWDGGRCHATHVIAMAAEAHKRGHEVGFVSSDKFAAELAALAMTSAVYTIPNRPPSPKPLQAEFPVYCHSLRHAQRMQALGFDNVQWLQTTTDQEVAAIKDFRPDVVVNDYRDTIRTAAEVTDVPVVGIIRSDGNVHGRRLGSWVVPPPDLSIPDCRDSFSEVRSGYDLSPIDDERYMFSGNVNLIPSIPAIDPLYENPGDLHYVGILSRWSRGDGTFEPVSAAATPRVFSYIGEPSRPAYGYESMLSEVIESEPDMGFYVVGNPAKYTTPPLLSRQRDGSVKVAPFISGPEATEDSSMVLTHGGHGTATLSLAMGRPIIGIGAFTSEAATTVRNIAAAGAGLYVPHSEKPLERRPSPHVGESWDMLGHWETELNSSRIHEAISTVLSDGSYTERAVRLGEELLSLGGVERAVDIIQSHAL